MNQPRDSKGRFCSKSRQQKQAKQPRASNGRFLSNKAPKIVHGFKGFDKDFQCLGMQYKVDKTYTVDGKLVCCKNGLHFCTNPIDVFQYYSPAGPNRYAEVTAIGETVGGQDTGDSKLCTNKLTINRELSLVEYCNKVVHNRLNAVPDMPIQSTNSSCKGRFALLGYTGHICIDENESGVAYDVNALVSITTERSSVSFASGQWGLAVTYGGNSIANGAYAIARGYNDVAISDKKYGLAVSQSGRAITCCDYSTAVCNNYLAALTLEGDYNVGVMCGRFADVHGKNCILIVKDVGVITELKLRKGTLVVLANIRPTHISESVVFVAGVDLKPAHKDNIYTGDQIRAYYQKHKGKRNASNS